MVGVTGCSAPKLQSRNVGTRKSPGSECEVAMWSLPPGDTVLQMLTYVALTAQAMTRALAAGRRSMDWAGVCMLGCHYRARRRHDPRRCTRALSAGLGAKPVLSRADGGGGLCHHFDRAACAPAEYGVSGARCDRARGVHHGRLRCRLADERLAADRDRGGHDHRLRRRRAARHPLQRRAAVVSFRSFTPASPS